MKIRQAQLESLQPIAERDFIDRLIDHVRAEHPEEVNAYAESDLRRMAANGISRARRYGISVESSIAAFVDLMFSVAPNFDEQEHIHEVLTDASYPPDARVELLGEMTLDADWEQADARYDESAWNVSFG